jgi:hypothetical protein
MNGLNEYIMNGNEKKLKLEFNTNLMALKLTITNIWKLWKLFTIRNNKIIEKYK